MSNWPTSIALTQFGGFIVQLSASRTEAPTCQYATFNIPKSNSNSKFSKRNGQDLKPNLTQIETKSQFTKRVTMWFVDSSVYHMERLKTKWMSCSIGSDLYSCIVEAEELGLPNFKWMCICVCVCICTYLYLCLYLYLYLCLHLCLLRLRWCVSAGAANKQANEWQIYQRTQL